MKLARLEISIRTTSRTLIDLLQPLDPAGHGLLSERWRKG